MTRISVAARTEVRREIVGSLSSRNEVTELADDLSPEALSLFEPPPDVVVFGWEQLGVEQEATIRTVRTAVPSTAVIAVVTDFTPADVTAAVGAGLGGLIRREEISACLALVVEAALLGQLVVPREAWAVPSAPALSVREKQALALVVMGFSNAEIAKKLYVTESTVKSHLSSAFSRLGVRTRREATALILDPDRGFGTGILAISEADRKQRRPAGDA